MQRALCDIAGGSKCHMRARLSWDSLNVMRKVKLSIIHNSLDRTPNAQCNSIWALYRYNNSKSEQISYSPHALYVELSHHGSLKTR